MTIMLDKAQVDLKRGDGPVSAKLPDQLNNAGPDGQSTTTRGQISRQRLMLKALWTGGNSFEENLSLLSSFAWMQT